MYQSIGDANNLEVGNDAFIAAEGEHDETEPTKPTKYSSLFLLTVAIWTACIGFGLFSLIHYTIPGLQGNPEAWETTDPGLNRLPKGHPTANLLMIVHWIGGIYMMAVGPLQLVPWFRQKYINVHRWMGRFYIIGALMAGGCATIFIAVYGTSRGWFHEDAGNAIFGISAVICAVQSYRTIKQGRIEQHKLWSWRLFAVVILAVTYRLYLSVYFGLIIFTSWEGSKLLNNLSFYSVFLNLLAVEVLAKYDWKPPMWLMWLALFLVVLTTLASFFGSWLPAMLGIQTEQGDYILDASGSGGA